MNALKEQLEGMKFACPQCHLPHNISSRDIERVAELVSIYFEACVGEDIEYDDMPTNKQTSYEESKLRAEIKNKWYA